MKIFLSYGHDSNVPLIKKIKEYLSKDDNGKLRHDVWIDTSEIKAGKNWRNCITEGIMSSDVVLAGLSKHSTRNPGVCRDEINISIGVKGGEHQNYPIGTCRCCCTTSNALSYPVA